MKFGIKLGSIEVQGIKLNDVEFTSEYTTKEFIDLVYAGKKFAQEMIEESPEIFMNLEKSYSKFQEIEEKQNKVNVEDFIRACIINGR